VANGTTEWNGLGVVSKEESLSWEENKFNYLDHSPEGTFHSTIPVLSGGNSFCAHPNGSVYSLNGTKVIQIDPKTKTAEVVASGFDFSMHGYHAIVANQYIYYTCAWSGRRLVEFNVLTREVNAYSVPCGGSDGYFDPVRNKLYLGPSNSNRHQSLVFDVINKIGYAINTPTDGSGYDGYHGFSKGFDGYAYCSTKTNVYKVDPDTHNVVHTYNRSAGKLIWHSNGNLYSAGPGWSKGPSGIVQLNPATFDTISIVNSESLGGSIWFAFNPAADCIYCGSTSTELVEYSFRTNAVRRFSSESLSRSDHAGTVSLDGTIITGYSAQITLVK
jgi:hypothetical protein